MAYSLSAIIARSSVLQQQAQIVPIVKVGQDLVMVPVTSEVLNLINNGVEKPSRLLPQHFEYYFSSMAEWMMRISEKGPIAYVEAEFHGGTGDQAVVVWRNQKILMSVRAIGAINKALGLLGVKAKVPRLADSSDVYAGDEFETVGLNRHRSTEEW